MTTPPTTQREEHADDAVADAHHQVRGHLGEHHPGPARRGEEGRGDRLVAVLPRHPGDAEDHREDVAALERRARVDRPDRLGGVQRRGRRLARARVAAGQRGVRGGLDHRVDDRPDQQPPPQPGRGDLAQLRAHAAPWSRRAPRRRVSSRNTCSRSLASAASSCSSTPCTCARWPTSSVVHALDAEPVRRRSSRRTAPARRAAARASASARARRPGRPPARPGSPAAPAGRGRSPRRRRRSAHLGEHVARDQHGATLRASARRSCRSQAMPAGSRPLAGSSRISTGGSPSRAWASAEPLPHAEGVAAHPPVGELRERRPARAARRPGPAGRRRRARSPAGGRGPSGRGGSRRPRARRRRWPAGRSRSR